MSLNLADRDNLLTCQLVDLEIVLQFVQVNKKQLKKAEVFDKKRQK